MKSNSLIAALAAFVLVSSLWGGCASNPAPDWNSRVGSYTFDQAVLELGPPTSQVTMSDGQKVAQWIVGRSGSSAFSVGMGGYSGNTGVGVSQGFGAPPRDKILRLTFSPDGKLAGWTRN